MQGSGSINKIAVLGAGVMGAQIAAHCVNAGIETLLFDLAADDKNGNALIEKAIANLAKLKPAPLALPQMTALLQAKNYKQHLAALQDCDLIIEAIGERLDWKEGLYQQITPYINNHAILASNTSGLSINKLCKTLPLALQNRFCGVHFFNPPRYMHLAELIPAESTAADLLTNLETWLTSRLGKGVIRAKDTPNFIANRIGVFSLLVTLHHAQQFDLSLDEVDALTGSLLGRPKSATFRTMDVVGLDTMQHVVKTMQEQLQDDPWQHIFQLPDWLTALIAAGALGQKTERGIYRKQGKTIEVFDRKSGKYGAVSGESSKEVKEIMANKDAKQRMQLLFNSQDKQAQFLTACYRDLFHYCAYHLQNIADTVGDVDLAMRWGFGWQYGPFETWQQAGIAEINTFLDHELQAGKTISSAKLPAWLNKNLNFYTEEGAFAPLSLKHQPRSQLPVYQRQLFRACLPAEKNQAFPVLFEDSGVKMLGIDDIAVVSFKSKANTVSQAVIDGLNKAIDKAEVSCQGLIIYQSDANNFGSGADLQQVAGLIKDKKLAAIENMISEFQQTVLRLKYSCLPTVAALRGRALGGGAEIMMHCDVVAAAFESYPGLVEIGMGLIPAGGGCKEMAMRAANLAENADLMTFLQPNFQQIATAFVCSNALEAKQRHFLRAQDYWVMHADEVLYAALARIKAMQAANYQPPLKHRFQVAGREGHATLQAGLVNWLTGGFISQYDYHLANQLAYVMCGGEVNEGEMVDEAWLLKLEKDAFMQLAENPLTQARIINFLTTGKPLRN